MRGQIRLFEARDFDKQRWSEAVCAAGLLAAVRGFLATVGGFLEAVDFRLMPDKGAELILPLSKKTQKNCKEDAAQ